MMHLGSPFDALHGAIASAVHQDIPEITYQDRDWAAFKGMTGPEQVDAVNNHTEPMITKTRRVYTDEVEVVMFPQTWGSTALGYGGIGGSAMTPAYTVVVSYENYMCVYFGGGRLAYRLDYNQMSQEGRERWRSDLQAHNLEDIRGSGKYR
jgi:hypothetical protein